MTWVYIQEPMYAGAMSPSLTYVEHLPPPDLAPWVACFWRIVGEAVDVPHRVLPDGCADLLFDLAGARASGGASTDLIGPMSTAHVVELRGAVDLLGVRLRPGTLAGFAGIRADELLDAVVPVSIGMSAAQLAESGGGARGLLIGALRRKAGSLNRPDPLVRHALSRWVRAESPDFPSISVLTRDLGLSERAFERRFVANVGLTPVAYRRLARLRSVLRLYARGSRGWAAIAAATGFSDQAHLVRDCRAFTGLTPTEWAASQMPGAGFLQDGAVTTI